MLPFPRIVGNTPEEQVSELYNYLIQFKETLEFALTNISADNLSPDLIKTLNKLGADIEQSHADREEELTQISKNTLTISDVCESTTFKEAVEDEVSKNVQTFSVNFETGHLEYGVTNEEG